MRMKSASMSVSLAVIAIVAALSATEPATEQHAPAAAPAVQAPQAAPPMPNCPELATAVTALMRNDVRQRDWANLTRYRDANRALSPVATGEDRVVFMGD